jgi:hypothetical protein
MAENGKNAVSASNVVKEGDETSLPENEKPQDQDI